MSNFKDRDILTGTYLLIVGRGAFHNLGLQACTSFVALGGGDKVIVREACFRRVIACATIEIEIRVVAQESPQLAQGHLVGKWTRSSRIVGIHRFAFCSSRMYHYSDSRGCNAMLNYLAPPSCTLSYRSPCTTYFIMPEKHRHPLLRSGILYSRSMITLLA